MPQKPRADDDLLHLRRYCNILFSGVLCPAISITLSRIFQRLMGAFNF
jgi:hypothetical protein